MKDNHSKRGLCEECLTDCENCVQRLIAEAARESDYGAVAGLSAIAQRIADLRDQVRAADWVLAASGPLPRQSASSPGKTRPPKKRRRASGKRGYPKFVRRGDSLVKIGWSKRKKAEYEHKAPWATAEQVIAFMAGAGAGGRLFTGDELIDRSLQEADQDIPTYQCYIVLAWLVDSCLVVKHGRKGYTVPDTTVLHDEAMKHWEKMV